SLLEGFVTGFKLGSPAFVSMESATPMMYPRQIDLSTAPPRHSWSNASPLLKASAHALDDITINA
ncbi:MAG TPA: hypothetical protein QGI03_15900, partial [Dehalococcoidia bacterium]|nr:hypothetical protein [Dehalococcoidia bacterium]